MAKNLEVWDITFCKVDDDGEPLLNKDGSVKLFQDTNRKFDFSWLSDAIDDDLVEYLQEISNG
tara:strand:- start:559 stop:747 length:189 start_codon:yes stop_codon:yes gene_type:complete